VGAPQLRLGLRDGTSFNQALCITQLRPREFKWVIVLQPNRSLRMCGNIRRCLGGK
jgi:hypothetical protein